MDALSRLLSLARTEIRLDVRCLLAAPFVLANDSRRPGEAEFHLLLSGACQLQTADGAVLSLERGDFVLLSHGSRHTLYGQAGGKAAPATLRSAGTALPVRSNDPDSRQQAVDLLCGRFLYGEGAGDLLAQALPGLLHVNLRGGELLSGLVALLRDEAAHRRPGAASALNALGQALFALALREYSAGAQVSAGVLKLACDSRIGMSVQAMLEQPGAAWSIASLGALAGMSRATYARHFLERSGATVGDLLQRIRMMHACELLRGTRRNLADIAQASGYQSESAFGKAFRQVVGDSPGRWRQSRRRAGHAA
ncbi:cupin domain-containing protein [Achromobacter denitrificans]